MIFSEKYKHVGYSYPAVPKQWQSIVEKAVVDIEKIMWPQKYLSFFLKRWIHYLATGNSVVRIKFNWADRLRKYFTGGMMITDIKDKYATLRIYGYFNDKIYSIIEQAEKDCENTCEWCGANENVKARTFHKMGWVYGICDKCYKEKMKEIKQEKNKKELEN